MSITWVNLTACCDFLVKVRPLEFQVTVLTSRPILQYKQLETVTIAKALQLEAAGATPALSCFNYDAMPSLKSLNLSIAVL